VSAVEVAVSDGPRAAERARWARRPSVGVCAVIVLAASALSLLLRSLAPLNIGGSAYDEGL
jgi:hypothetical protein